MKPKLLRLSGLLFGLIGLVLLLSSGDTTHAQTFNPTYEITVVDARAGANSGWVSHFNIPSGDVQFGGAVFFVPPEWDITPGDEIPIGAVVGELLANATLGIINAACFNALPVGFTMLNASIDPSDTVDYLDTDENNTEDYFEDKDKSGLQDGIEKYPDFITRVLDDVPGDEVGNPLQPIRRSAGITVVAGVNVLLQFLIFEPGTFINENIPNDESLGYPSVTLLQNVGDPASDPIPGAITDFCTPLSSTNFSFGVSKDNACTDSAATALDPICEVRSALFLECDDLLDNDVDKTVNDGCPTVGDEAEAECEGEEDNDNDGWVNDGCPAIEEDPDVGSPGPGEDSTPTDPSEGGVTLFANPPEGTYTFTTIAAGQRDADGDGYENTLDTCPFIANQGDPRIGGDGDLDNDGLDKACDPNDDPQAEGTNSDEDLDGYLNRQDNCPLVPNGEDGTNQRDSDDDAIGDDCDPNPDNKDTEGEQAIVEASQDITIGPGGPPAQETPAADKTPTSGSDEDDGGGGGTIIIVVAVIAAVVVLGGGGYYLIRRRGA